MTDNKCTHDNNEEVTNHGEVVAFICLDCAAVKSKSRGTWMTPAEAEEEYDNLLNFGDTF